MYKNFNFESIGIKFAVEKNVIFILSLKLNI